MQYKMRKFQIAFLMHFSVSMRSILSPKSKVTQKTVFHDVKYVADLCDSKLQS